MIILINPKIIPIGMCLSLCALIKAQTGVGINTTTPKADLDIQGSLGIRQTLYLQATDTQLGKTGVSGTVIVSRGSGLAPVWKILRRPDVDPFKYFMIDSDATSTQNGVVIGNVNSGYNLYTLDQSLSTFLSPANTGGEITGLSKTFTVNSTTSRVLLSFQAIAQINSNGISQGADFACGIFIDDKLKVARPVSLTQTSSATGPFYTYDLVGIASNLSIGNHTAKVACTRRSSYGSLTGNLGISKAVVNNINDFMAQSSLKMEAYEIPNPNTSTPIYIP
ncbi:hypothetical protein [Chryseobacterium indologenes]|uniref:hypothetical protein n=1 Tax=Chryseobacterium indologenes TaxID=253 RepID=UPI000F4F3EAB|nr:hypothetical protein [Chryseobacterium indologenes]QIX82354.1 hypothetical protein FOB56_14365 [Chryseobacterium indologenes]UDQ51989.1 hypothetical protein LJF28_11140 [Chryseobacterium indologenes]